MAEGKGATTERVGCRLCIGSAIIGAIGLVGAIVGAGVLTRIIPGEPAISSSAALALILLGAAGALRHRDDVGASRRALSMVVAFVVLVIGTVTIVDYAVGI